MTYSLNGRQYIVVGVSGGNYTGEYIAFRLPASELPRTNTAVSRRVSRRRDTQLFEGTDSKGSVPFCFCSTLFRCAVSSAVNVRRTAPLRSHGSAPRSAPSAWPSSCVAADAVARRHVPPGDDVHGGRVRGVARAAGHRPSAPPWAAGSRPAVSSAAASIISAA